MPSEGSFSGGDRSPTDTLTLCCGDSPTRNTPKKYTYLLRLKWLGANSPPHNRQAPEKPQTLPAPHPATCQGRVTRHWEEAELPLHDQLWAKPAPSVSQFCPCCVQGGPQPGLP